MQAKLWAAFYPSGKMAMWLGARRTRREVMARAVEGMMGAREYQECATDSQRWRQCFKRGCRIKQVKVTYAG